MTKTAQVQNVPATAQPSGGGQPLLAQVNPIMLTNEWDGKSHEAYEAKYPLINDEHIVNGYTPAGREFDAMRAEVNLVIMGFRAIQGPLTTRKYVEQLFATTEVHFEMNRSTNGFERIHQVKQILESSTTEKPKSPGLVGRIRSHLHA